MRGRQGGAPRDLSRAICVKLREHLPGRAKGLLALLALEGQQLSQRNVDDHGRDRDQEQDAGQPLKAEASIVAAAAAENAPP